MSTESVMPSNHSILCRPLLFLLSTFPSIRVFSGKSALHIRWPKYWGFSFSISLSSEYSGMTSFRMDWLDLLDVKGNLIPQFWSETKYLYISKVIWVIPMCFGKPLARKFSSLFQRWRWKVCSPKSSLRCSICQGWCFPQSRLLSLVPGAQAQLPSRGTSPGGSATRKGGSSATSGCFLLNQKNHQLEQLLSLRMRKPGEMTGATKSVFIIFPNTLDWVK